MAILIEGQSVVIQKQFIVDYFVGGLDAFLDDIPNQRLIDDGKLLCVGFMSTNEAYNYANAIANRMSTTDLAVMKNNIAVVRQGDSEIEADWLKCSMLKLKDSENEVFACILAGDINFESIKTPAGWSYEKSLSSDEGGFGLSQEEFNARFDFIRSEGNIDIYLDKTTGEEVYVGNTKYKNS